MLSFIYRFRWYILGGVLGAIGGYTYWFFWGCTNGCSITSSPVNSSAYWSFFGAFLLGSLTISKKENSKSNDGE